MVDVLSQLRKKGFSIFTALLALSFVCDPALAGPERFAKRGYIQNDKGKKCWYTQRVNSESTYFHGNAKANAGVITFNDPRCMSDSGLGLDINKMMINNVISRWYSQPDAKFQTRVSEMFNGSLFQKKGKCIQSKTYPAIGITVDYFTKNNSITRVIHGMAVQGCKK